MKENALGSAMRRLPRPAPRWAAAVLLMAAAAAPAAAASPEDRATGPAGVLFPADLGPAWIDVSEYPEEHRRTYEEVFLPLFGFYGTVARVLNAPLVELDEQAERSERGLHPRLFESGAVAPSRDGWRRTVQAIRIKPPCCGACPLLSLEEARALYRFLVYDSLRRKTGEGAEAWRHRHRNLVARFKTEYPDGYARWSRAREREDEKESEDDHIVRDLSADGLAGPAGRGRDGP